MGYCYRQHSPQTQSPEAAPSRNKKVSAPGVRADRKRWGTHCGPETPDPTKFTLRKQSDEERESRGLAVIFKIRREKVFGKFSSIWTELSRRKEVTNKLQGILEEELSNFSLSVVKGFQPKLDRFCIG